MAITKNMATARIGAKVIAAYEAAKTTTYQVGNKTEGCGHTHKTPEAALQCLQSYQDAGAPKSYKIYELLADGSYKPIAPPVVRKASAKRLGPVVIQPRPIAAAIVVESQFLATLPQPKAAKPERKAPIGTKVKARDLSHLPPVPLHRTPVADGGLGGNPADRPITVDMAHVRLLEDPRNGIILLQVEKPTATGSVCVYNNGKRVAAGEVAPETIANLLRPVPNAPSIQEAAYQLLNPIVPSVEVTPLAARHLTAVLDASRKEIAPTMAKLATTENVPVAKSKKFAAPATAKKGAAKKAAPTGTGHTKASKAAAVAGQEEALAATTASKKSTKAPKEATAERAPRNSYAGKKIKVINKEHGAREGTKRAQGLDIILKAKTTDDALPKLLEIGADATFIRFAVAQGFVELA